MANFFLFFIDINSLFRILIQQGYLILVKLFQLKTDLI
ncbi:MAG: hypothetical protein JWP78_1720 [Mucilaginibacter sp.]|nr:hypothetical protein [Mucilaginibacter sp.]